MARRTIKAGDTWPPITGVLRQSPEGPPEDLTGVNAVRIWLRSDTLAVHTDPCDVIDPENGVVSYHPLPEETAVPDLYKLEWEVDYGDGENDRPRIRTFPNSGYEELMIEPALDPEP